MVDIHQHLLFDLDDGPKDIETSVAMARASVASGVTHVVCTPHASGQFDFDPAANQGRIAALQARLAAERIPLTLGLGCDFHLSYDNIQDAKADPARFSINGLGYLLVEIPDFGVPRGLTETFYELQVAGLMPILTHPERNPTLQAHRERLIEWMRAGVLLQITGDSVTGKMGKPAQKMAHELLAKRWVHFLATDAHNTTHRPPRLDEAREVVARKYGRDYAESLVEANPRAVFEGRAFDPQAEPIGLYDDYKPKNWFQRVFGSSSEEGV
jgi:protein-tyrosine phosphatase